MSCPGKKQIAKKDDWRGLICYIKGSHIIHVGEFWQTCYLLCLVLVSLRDFPIVNCYGHFLGNKRNENNKRNTFTSERTYSTQNLSLFPFRNYNIYRWGAFNAWLLTGTNEEIMVWKFNDNRKGWDVHSSGERQTNRHSESTSNTCFLIGKYLSEIQINAFKFIFIIYSNLTYPCISFFI